MSRGALYALLANRTYLGETHHKGRSHKGEHTAIVPRDLFDAVRERLAAARGSVMPKVTSPQNAPFMGLLFDEAGERMLATYTIKANGARYRYYASEPNLKGERSEAAITRIPAPAFEGFLAGVFARLELPTVDQQEQLRCVIDRIEVQSNAVMVRLRKDGALEHWRASNADLLRASEEDIISGCRSRLTSGETLAAREKDLVLTLPVRARFRGGRASVKYAAGAQPCEPAPDMALIKAIARAHRWRRMLIDGEVHSIEELALRLDQDRGHVGLTLKLAYLSPHLTQLIVRGEQPRALNITRILNADMPLFWHRQVQMFAARGNS